MFYATRKLYRINSLTVNNVSYAPKRETEMKSGKWFGQKKFVCVCCYHGKTSLEISVNLNVNRKQKYNNNCWWIISVAVVVRKPGQLRFRIANSQFPWKFSCFERAVFFIVVRGTKKTHTHSLLAFFPPALVHSRNGMVYSIFCCCYYYCSGFDFAECRIEVEVFFFFSRAKSTLMLFWLWMWCLNVSPVRSMFHSKMLSSVLWREF